MHPKRRQITVTQMKTIARGMDGADVPLTEVTHGDGLGVDTEISSFEFEARA